MKSAKEMFEQLGYEYDYIQNKNSEDTITYHKDNLHIQFNLIGKQVVIQNDSSYVFYGYAVFFINQDLLQAINKQVEELHWNDITVNIDVKLDGKKVMEAMRGGNNA